MNRLDYITLIVAILSSTVLSSIVTGGFQLMAAKKKKETGVSAGTRMLLYDRIKFLGKVYISRGSIKSDELEDIIEMHKVYHNELGGNGFLDSVMDQVKKLSIEE